MPKPNTIHTRAMLLLYKELKKARISLCKAEEKANSYQETANLKNRIEELEYLTEIVTREGGKDA